MGNDPLPAQTSIAEGNIAPDDNASADINENMLSEESVRAHEERLRLALDAARMGVWDWNLQTEELSWSAWHYALFGLDAVLATGTYDDFAERVHPDDREELRQAVQRARDTDGEYRHEYRVVWPDGSLHWVAGHGRFLYDADGKAIRMTGVLMDATERRWLQAQMEAQMAQAQQANRELEANRRQLEEINAQLAHANARLEELVTTDELTGLKNKRAFEAFLAREYQAAVRYEHPLSVILLDADKFKQVNDRCGHPAGDAVLRCMGELLQTHSRQTDMVARYGGEEFVYVLPDTDGAGAIAFAERVRTALETYAWVEHCAEHPVTASLGAATRTSATQSAAELIAQADRALYRSKRRGRNRVTHFADMS